MGFLDSSVVPIVWASLGMTGVVLRQSLGSFARGKLVGDLDDHLDLAA